MADVTMTYNQLAHAAAIDVTQAFEQDFSDLRTMLANSNFATLPVGTALMTTETTATIKTDAVEAGAEIPVSTITATDTIRALAYKKYRTLVPFEQIGQQGPGAVANAGKILSGQLQKDVKASIADGLALGTSDAQGTNLQTACANAWAKLQEVREGFASTPVFFCSPTTAAGYLGTANVTTQTAFGLDYLVGFLGLGTLILSTTIPAATVYATAAENINVSCANVAAIADSGFTMDESGVIAAKVAPLDDHASIQIVELAGIDVLPLVKSHVVKATIAVSGD